MSFSQITIKDIARELGISPSTVSRALKDHPDISTATKKAVNELAKKLNYQPNIVALSLRSKKTNTLGVIIPEVVHFFFSTVINGIESVAHEAGYSVILAQSRESAKVEADSLRTMFNSRVDGILLSISRETTNVEHIQAIIKRGMPIVFFDRKYDMPFVSSVTVDDYVGAKNAVKHLIDQGYKRIMHIKGPSYLLITIDRYRGYVDALKEAHIEVDSNLLFTCETGEISEACAEMKKRLPKDQPEAIFASTDPLAIGAIKGIKEMGLSVPKDIAVVGFSNWQNGEYMQPTLTTVDQPGFEMGRQATKLLISQIEQKVKDKLDPMPVSKVLDTKLIVRESSIRK